MALTVGSRLGHYDVTALIGEGGMGQVYRATDTQLGRDVALKILPDAFAADPDRLARFQREAQVLASLNHPNIAQIHGIEKSADIQALVLELVEGPMGVVYRARDTKLDRDVALKVVPEACTSDPDRPARFEHVLASPTGTARVVHVLLRRAA